MTVETTDIENRLGMSFSLTTNPTSTQVSNFINEARTIFEAETGSAPDEDDANEKDILVEITVNLIKRYFWANAGFPVARDGVAFSQVEILPPSLLRRLHGCVELI